MNYSIQKIFLSACLAVTLVGCASTVKKADISSNVRASLDQAGYKDVSVSQDLDKGVITLGGKVRADGDKMQAENLARTLASNQVVANQIVVIPPGTETESKKINTDLDKGIESNLDAALIAERLHDDVKYSVKSQVVTITGRVDTADIRARAQAVTAAVPNVQQVVNEVQIRRQKATSN